MAELSTGAVEASIVSAEDVPPLSDRPRRTVRALREHPLLDATWSRYVVHTFNNTSDATARWLNFHAPRA